MTYGVIPLRLLSATKNSLIRGDTYPLWPQICEKIPVISPKCYNSYDIIFKLKAKRRKAAQEGAGGNKFNLPNFSDQEAIQKFFLHEVQLGEELLATGDIENGVEHLSMAVAVCGQPHSLLGKMRFDDRLNN